MGPEHVDNKVVVVRIDGAAKAIACESATTKCWTVQNDILSAQADAWDGESPIFSSSLSPGTEQPSNRSFPQQAGVKTPALFFEGGGTLITEPRSRTSKKLPQYGFSPFLKALRYSLSPSLRLTASRASRTSSRASANVRSLGFLF